MRPPDLITPGPVADAMDHLNVRAAAMAGLLNLACALSAWPAAGTGLAILGSGVLLLPLNFGLSRIGWRRLGVNRAETIRSVLNLAGILFTGHLLHWQPVVWLWLPFSAALMHPRRGRAIELTLYLVAVPALALYEGAHPTIPALFVLLSLVTYALADARGRVIGAMVEEREAQRRALAAAHAEIQQAQAMAIQQEKLSSLGMMAAGIAHEINNPMSYVTSNLSSLLGDLREIDGLPGILEEYRDDVVPATLDGVRRVNTIVADLRRFARGDPETPVAYDLKAEIETAARIARARFDPRCRLELDLGELPEVVGHPQQLAQVVVNLLVNAAQAVVGEGRVTLACHPVGDGVNLSVADTGVGMDEETRAHLFEPFFTTKPVGVGTGLGLAVIHGIVEAHRGRISVESTPGKGSRFDVWLPRLAPAPAG